MQKSITCCLSYAGDEYDHLISRNLGHHPRCKHLRLKFNSYEQKKGFANAVNDINDERVLDMIVKLFQEEDNE